MSFLLKFRLSDGLIDGLWEANNRAILDAQVVPGDPDFGYLPVDTDMRGQTILDTQYITAGALTEKTVLTLAGTPTPFAADGVTTCTVTVTPFHPCSLLVNGIPTVLTDADPDLVLTSDAPQIFTIALVPIGPYRASPITLEAT